HGGSNPAYTCDNDCAAVLIPDVDGGARHLDLHPLRVVAICATPAPSCPETSSSSPADGPQTRSRRGPRHPA
ncbi:MAG TPA: hypothetical protein VGA36_03875, partial [Nitriliruptorales bacterium]